MSQSLSFCCVLRLYVFTIVLTTLSVCWSAELKPNVLFSKGAVLQQGISLPVWGTGASGETVRVSINGVSGESVTGGDGKWQCKIPPLQAGGPFVLKIESRGKTLDIDDIYVGEVWFCSGQSNMDLQLAAVYGGNDAVESARNDPMVRLFRVRRSASATPSDALFNSWSSATDPVAIGQASAVGYFFIREIRRRLNVPVGLIQAAWGATTAEAWTSREALAANPLFRPKLKSLNDALSAYPKKLGNYLAQEETFRNLFNEALVTYDRDCLSAKAASRPAPTPPWCPDAPPDPASVPNPSHCFNGMVAPVIPYALRGVIWYQGEQNTGAGWAYRPLLETMFADWRKRWGLGEFPIYVVQLPAHKKVISSTEPSTWAELRESQRLFAREFPNTAIVVTTDLGSETDIHPKLKEPVGARLALAARALTYGEKVEYSGPAFEGFTVSGQTIRIEFSHSNGLRAGTFADSDKKVFAKTERLVGFTVAGEDQIFWNADASVEGTSVIVSSPKVPKPVAVRYGWADYPVANLQNAVGLWASPFRSDVWPFASQPKGPPPAINAADVQAMPVPESGLPKLPNAPFLVQPIAVQPPDSQSNGWSIPASTINGAGFGTAAATAIRTGAFFVRELPFAYPDVSRFTGSAWLTDRQASGSARLIFDLGHEYVITGAVVWNTAGEKASRRFRMWVSAAASPDFKNVSEVSGWIPIQTGAFNLKRFKSGPIAPDHLEFQTPVNARWVVVSDFESYQDNCGLEEIRFVGINRTSGPPKL